MVNRTDDADCPACCSPSWTEVEEWQGFRIVSCGACGLEYTLNPDYRPDRYKDGYRGAGDLPVPEEHVHVYRAPAERLRLETRALVLPPPYLTPAERLALRWLVENAPSGATIVDCGCGTGRFLRALSRKGFRAVGVDISAEIVSLLNGAGLAAREGKAPDFPWNEPPPFAISFFEVLEHIPAPVDVLGVLRERFPGTVIVASVPSPYRACLLFRSERGLSDYPPNHFLRWTPQALEKAFGRAGYRRVEVHLPKPRGSEILPGLGSLVFRWRRSRSRPTRHVEREGEVLRNAGGRKGVMARLEATGALWLLWVYQRGADLVGRPRAWWFSCRGASSASMLVIAQP